MPRREFPKSVRVAVIKRATVDRIVYCETCKLPAKRWQIDHVRPDGLLGEPVIENAALICEACYEIKNPADTSVIARTKRVEGKNLRAGGKPTPLSGRNRATIEADRETRRAARGPQKPSLMPRPLYADVAPQPRARQETK